MTDRPYHGPLFSVATIPPPEGAVNPLVTATMNPGMDAPWLVVRGVVPDLRVHMEHHAAFSIHLEGSFDDLKFLVPCADLITTLSLQADIADVRALARLAHVHTLMYPPPKADGLLDRLPRLRRLSLQGVHDLERLRGCATLRELTLSNWHALMMTGTAEPIASDLTALPPLQGLEMLELLHAGLNSLAGIERLTGLRTLRFDGLALRDAAGAEFLEERFGFDALDRLVAKRAADRRRLSERTIRLDADRRRATAAAAARRATRGSSASVTARVPACVVILIDRSRSTAQRFGIDLRVIRDPKAEEHHITMRYGDGPDGDMLLCEGITAGVNAFLRALAPRCIVRGRVAHDVHVGIVEYGARVGSAWGGALKGRGLVPIAEIAAHPRRAAADGPIWLKPESVGETPLGEALAVARDLIDPWAREHADSVPPVVINLTASRLTGDDIVRHAWGIRSVATTHGPALLFTVEREGSYGVPYFGIESYESTAGELLFKLASPLPPTIAAAAQRAGYPLIGTPRGYLHDAAAADFENALHIFTALPGLPWDDDVTRQPLPPHRVSKAELAENRYESEDEDETPITTDWKPPKLRGPMTEDLFWKVIETSRRGVDDPEEQAERLVQLLERFGESDLLKFQRLLDARMNTAYRWDLWAVAYITQGGCSDDGFEYFCAWLIGQGRKFFEASLADPAHAANRIEPGSEAEFEPLLGVASTAYESNTGKRDFHERAGPVKRVGPKGRKWTEDDLPKRYPRLVKKYG